MGLRIASAEAAQPSAPPAERERAVRSKRRYDNDLADSRLHGHPAETSHQARSETDPDAIAAAGDQAAADVDARTVGSTEPGDGREPDAGGGPDRGTPARRSGRAGAEIGAGAAAEQDRHLGRPGLRILLRRLPGRRLPAARAAGSEGAAADREHALDVELALRPSHVAAVDADRRVADSRHRIGDHRQP